MASLSRPNLNPPFKPLHKLVKDLTFFPTTIHLPNHVTPRVVCHALNTTESNGQEQTKGSGTKLKLEDRILEDTVPLAGFVRMILHSGKYKCGDRLSPEHQRIILENVLPYHPSYKLKIGCGVDHIMFVLWGSEKEKKSLLASKLHGSNM
ncbi:hypothetical protein ACFE04_000738 [Oxalis oulophora]